MIVTMVSILYFQHDFFKSLDEEDDGDDDNSEFVAQDDEKELYRLSDASGQLTYKLEKKGDVSLGDFDTKVRYNLAVTLWGIMAKHDQNMTEVHAIVHE